MGLLGELKINYLKISLFECELRPGCSTETAGKTDDGSSARSRDERTPRRPFEGDAPKTFSKRISDFTSQSAERSHRRLSLTKPGKSQSFYSLSAAAALHSWADELHLLPPTPQPPSRLPRPPRGAPASLLEGLGFFISGKRAGKDREDE